ncbi:nuclear transport factor 2 family protein [Streptomyces sp. NPDC088115]|uniref:nuclear transport factor 2 family protein n=1 Tax=Streptomyces sp. NPDC088115 TaxID=3365824 RepID=UPI003819C0D3
MNDAQRLLMARRKALGVGAALGSGTILSALSAPPAVAAEKTALRSHAGFPAMPRSVLNFFLASQRADAGAWAESFAVDGLFFDPVGTEPLRGREAIRRHIASVLPEFRPFLGITPVEAHTVAGSVAVSWRAAAVTKSNRPVNWSGINIYDLDGHGLIKVARAYFSQAVFQAQLDPDAA